MKFPYAIRDFDALITEGYLYIDRTDRIPVMETLGKELLFLRPRRFGKSLWLSTLMNYYDIAKVDEFDQLFGNLAIGQNPTPLRNHYVIMKWDFSQVQSHGVLSRIEEALHDHINVQIEKFQRLYGALLKGQSTLHPTNALYSFDSLLGLIRASGHKLYLFIDEYDNFANEVMMGQQGDNQQRYTDLVKGEGMFKTFFKNIKSAGSGEGLDRVFMTGVSPIVMNDVTSGANVTKNVTWHPYLSDLCGFRQEEVQMLVNGVVAQCGLPPARATEAMEMLQIFYDGSRFVLRAAENAPNVYNPTLVFYFLEELQEFCRYPDNMLDNNLAPDYHKLVYISNHPAGKKLLLDALNGNTNLHAMSISARFGVKEMLQSDKQRDHLAALLCYWGALTIKGQTSDAQITVQIPNMVMRNLYTQRILEMTLSQSPASD